MSSFFTLPAARRKRKRVQPSDAPVPPRKQKFRRKDDAASISGSDATEDEGQDITLDRDGAFSQSEDDDDVDNNGEYEDPAAKRLRLAEQYLANTQRETLDEIGFDAADVDQDNLRRRMGDRLKESAAENQGKLYRFIADEMNWSASSSAQFRTDTKSLTGVAVARGFLYTASKDMTLIKWSLPGNDSISQKPRKVLFSRGNKNASEHHRAAILCVAASADGNFVVTGGADNRLIIWKAAELKPLKIFTGQHRDNGHRDSILSVAFRRGTNQFFSASKDRTVKIWSCNELAYVETLFGHQDEVLDVAALEKEVCVSVGARDRTARYWRVVEETQLVFRGGGSARGRGSRPTPKEAIDERGADMSNVDEHEGSIDRIAFVDDDTFVTGSDNGALSLWSIHKKKAVFTLPLAHGVEPPPSREERSAEMDPTVQYLDTEALMNVRSQPRWITSLKTLPLSNIIVSGSWDGWVRAFKITNDKRRIESLGCICDATSTGEGESGSVITGVINDLAIVENGDRAKEGLIIAAVVGEEHRLGRWKARGGKNIGFIFKVPRVALISGRDDDDDNDDDAVDLTAFDSSR